MNSTTKRSYKKVDIEPFFVGSANATLSADGSILASAVHEDIVIINRDTDEVVHSLQGDGDLVSTLQISPDGNYLAIVSQSQLLKIFNLQTSSFVKSYKLSSVAYISACDSTSSLFAFGLTDGSVVVWDIESGFVTHNFKGHGSTLSALSFYGELNSRNWKLASGDIMGSVRIWDLVKRKCVKTMTEHSSAVRGVSFNSTGELFISGGRDNTCILWNAQTWKEIKTVPIEHAVESAGFIDLEGKEYCYSAGTEGILRVWDRETETLVASSPASLESSEELTIMEVITLPEENESLILVMSDQTIVELDISIELEEDTTTTLPIKRRLAGNHGTIADMRYVGPNLDKLALATNSPALRIVDLENRPLDMEVFEGHTDLLNMLDSTIDGLWIATAAKDNTVRLWRYSEEEEKFTCYAVFEGHASSVTAVALPRTPIQSYPKFIITASEDLTIKKWTVPKPTANDNEVKTVKTSEFTRRAHDKMIHSIDISPNDDFLATASHDKLAKVWDLATGETVGILKGHKRPVYDVKFCAYDKLIVTGSGDQTAKVWSLDDYTCQKTFQGQTNAIQRVSFLSKNQFIIGAGADGLIKIWELSSGDCVQTLDNHDNRIWALTIKNDGEQFVSADADGSITIWSDNTQEAQDLEAEARKERVEKEQSLQNYINKGDWVNAFLLALSLDHPMRLYNVLKSCIASNQDKNSTLGSLELEAAIGKLEDDKIVVLFKRIRDWNTNARFFEVSQKLIKVMLTTRNTDKLSQIPGIMNYIDSIIPYSERHYSRIDDMVEQSYILEYAVKCMDELI